MIHIVNGDVVGAKLHNLEGEVLVWREMYDFGPIYPNLSEKHTIHSRSLYLEEKAGIPSSIFIENCQTQLQFLLDLPTSTEITLWFEHDRYDQAMLIYLLHELSKEGFSNLYMVTTDHFPGVNPFYGFGQLTSEQLTRLYSQQKERISNEQIIEAENAWIAYTSAKPQDLEAWITTSRERLPYLKRALQAHLEYLPSTANGLNSVENLILHFTLNNFCSFSELFSYISNKRIHDGLSDLHLAAIISELTKGSHPLLNCTSLLPNRLYQDKNSTISLTPYGKEVLQGKKDRFYFLGIDWWLGGIHLQDDRWRWDGNRIIHA